MSLPLRPCKHFSIEMFELVLKGCGWCRKIVNEQKVEEVASWAKEKNCIDIWRKESVFGET